MSNTAIAFAIVALVAFIYWLGQQFTPIEIAGIFFAMIMAAKRA